MKIAFVSAAGSVHTVKWVNALARRGHTVRLYSLPNHKNIQQNIDPEVTVIYLKTGGFQGYFLNAKELKQQVDAFGPDVVNCHYASGYGTLVRLAKLHPLLLSVWGSDVYEFPLKSPIHKKMVLKNLQKADALASTSHVMAKQVNRVFGFQKEIFITPFGVDCGLFAPAASLESREEFRIGAVKALEPTYGMGYLIEAFALFDQMIGEETKTSLVIYGKGEQKEELQRQIDSLGLSAKAKLAGVVPNTEVPAILNQMDVVCLPSLSESFGVAAVEAMACGVPVIASDVDGFLETVEHDVTGFLVPTKDPQAMAKRMLELANNPDLRHQMGAAGRERALRLYDFQKNVDAMEIYYQKTIEAYAARKF